MVQNMRILCLCESYRKTSMWYHYADKYIDDEPLVSTAGGVGQN